MEKKPFPWKCFRCREKAVRETSVDYESSVEHDGRSYAIHISALQVPQCGNCGALVMTDEANREVTRALRKAAGLLSPEAIRGHRLRLQLTQKQLAARLGIADATLSRWETGAQIQQRAMDRLLRLYFQFPAARAALEEETPLLSLEAPPPPNAEASES